MIKMLNVTEFAEILQVKEQTVYAWVHYKQLPKEIYRKLGRKTRFIEDIRKIFEVVATRY